MDTYRSAESSHVLKPIKNELLNLSMVFVSIPLHRPPPPLLSKHRPRLLSWLPPSSTPRLVSLGSLTRSPIILKWTRPSTTIAASKCGFLARRTPASWTPWTGSPQCFLPRHIAVRGHRGRLHRLVFRPLPPCCCPHHHQCIVGPRSSVSTRITIA